MFTGKIVRFNKDRGFGFITREDSGSDIFFFADSILNREDYFIQNGLIASYEIAPGYKGPQAVNVTVSDEHDLEDQDDQDEESTY